MSIRVTSSSFRLNRNANGESNFTILSSNPSSNPRIKIVSKDKEKDIEETNIDDQKLVNKKEDKDLKKDDKEDHYKLFQSLDFQDEEVKERPFSDSFVGSYSCKGYDSIEEDLVMHTGKKNQDRGCVVYPFHDSMHEALFLILDGHGADGHLISQYVMENLVDILDERYDELQKSPSMTLKSAFNQANSLLEDKNLPFDATKSGTTCTTIYLNYDKMYVAFCGDSRAILGRETDNVEVNNPRNVIPIQLTRDHKPDLRGEYERIIVNGGKVQLARQSGISSRVYTPHAQGGLAMTRSIGDLLLKPYGVISEPEVEKLTITNKDHYVILASDGIWEFMNNDEVIDHIETSLSSGMTIDDACEELINYSIDLWNSESDEYCDDITVIVFKLPLPGFEH